MVKINESYVDEEGVTITPLNDKFPEIPDIRIEDDGDGYCYLCYTNSNNEEICIDVNLKKLKYEIADDIIDNSAEDIYYMTDESVMWNLLDYYSPNNTTDFEKSAIEYFIELMLEKANINIDNIIDEVNDKIRDTDAWKSVHYDACMADKADWSRYDF